ncbi:UNVERIFIED_CONTAM: hypothetical protein HHA_319980 [Hammondia hammondi]|eukprot:XP_008885167.1 hypothetical protein HHA_319980 [Hammondia hammondi]
MGLWKAGENDSVDSNFENTAACDLDAADPGEDAESEGREKADSSSGQTHSTIGRENVHAPVGSIRVSRKSSKAENASDNAGASTPASVEASDGEESGSVQKASSVSSGNSEKARKSDGAAEPLMQSARPSSSAFSILKKSSTASRRSSKLSVRFGETELSDEENPKPAGVVAELSSVMHDYRHAPESSKTDNVSWSTSEATEIQHAYQQLRQREKESVAAIDSTLQSLVVSSSGGSHARSSDASGITNLKSLSSTSEPILSELTKKLQKRRKSE